MRKTTTSLIIMLLSAGPASADPPTAERPTYPIGDSFDYTGKFNTVDCQHWEISELDADGALQTRCGNNIAYFSKDGGALMRIIKTDGTPLVTFTPASPAMPFPLHLGSTWGGKFRLDAKTQPVTPNLEENCEVTAWESVTVAAGTLDAFRYECVTHWSVWPLSGDVTVTSWYAPAAKSVVKVINTSDSDWNIELAHFNVK